MKIRLYPTSNRLIKHRLFRGASRCPCMWCGRKLNYAQATIEHVTPKAFGGLNSMDNLGIACYICNQKRGQYTASARDGKFSFDYAEAEFLKWVAAKVRKARRGQRHAPKP